MAPLLASTWQKEEEVVAVVVALLLGVAIECCSIECCSAAV